MAGPDLEVTLNGSGFRPGQAVRLQRPPGTNARTTLFRPDSAAANELKFTIRFDGVFAWCGLHNSVLVQDPEIINTSDPESFRLPCPNHVLKVLSYNIAMLPAAVVCERMCKTKDTRAPLIASHPFLRDHDVVILQEAFTDDHRNSILKELQSDYPYWTRILGKDRGAEQDGGVIILSKWPIDCPATDFPVGAGRAGVPSNACGGERRNIAGVDIMLPIFPGEQRLYESRCAGNLATEAAKRAGIFDDPGVDMDCLADKGVLYARINKDGKRYHLFGTHLDSGAGEADAEARRLQLGIIQDFVDELTAQGVVVDDEPVIIGGDFNIALGSAEYLDSLLAELKVTLPAIGQDHPNRIDYVFHSRTHLVPGRSMNEVLSVWHGDFGQLSDHDAILGSFDFGTEEVFIPIEPVPGLLLRYPLER
jgi:endonuclease/exonuclease/phosphatase family metal-dependent hydrolase